MYQNKFRGDDTKTFQIFGVLIGNAKITRKLKFQPASPLIKYYQNTSNNCCLSSLESAFHCINDNSDVPDLVNIVEELLTPETENCKNITNFTNAIMSSKKKTKR